MGRDKDLQIALQQYFGFSTFRPLQQEISTALLAGRDVLAVLPTGGGKSLCYQLPALLLPGLTLVVSPLVALMEDQVAGLTALGIPATCLHASLDFTLQSRRRQALLRGEYRLLYISPERLAAPYFRRFLAQLPISLCIVDEAHCISEWGHHFRPEYLRIAEALAELPERPAVGAFTATATPQVQRDIGRRLALRSPATFHGEMLRTNLYWEVVHAYSEQEKIAYIEQYLSGCPNEAGIIYCATRKAVDELSLHLQQGGFSVAPYHAGLSAEERQETYEDFMYDRIRVIVATNAFGMGIDKPDVRFVLHYQLPSGVEAYYQEAGRAGRDGLPAECILLDLASDVRIREFLLAQSGANQAAADSLHALRQYCSTSSCLPQTLLHYFGVESTACGNCANCLRSEPLADMTAQARHVFHVVSEWPHSYGIGMLTKILCGKVPDEHPELRRLRYYGSRSHETQRALQQEIQAYITAGFLARAVGRFPTLTLTEAGRNVLAGRESVQLPPGAVNPPKRASRQAKPTRKGDRRPEPANPVLYDALRAERLRLAQQEKVRPYVIFNNETLLEMATELPQTLAAMARIKGVGDYKLHRYGNCFLQIIKEHRRDNL